MAGLTQAFGPGFDPGLPQSDQALDARVHGSIGAFFHILDFLLGVPTRNLILNLLWAG